MNAEANSRPPWERMMRFHNLMREKAFPNCAQIARHFEVTPRTIMRDKDFMRDRLNLPIDYDNQRKGYYYTQPVDQFPQMPFTEAEVFAMLIAHKAIAQYRGTPFEQPLALAFGKLTGQLDTAAKYSLGNLDYALSFRPFACEDADLEVFEILTRALKEKRVLKFQYRNLDAERFQERVVHPYHIACVDNHWYLFAHDVKRGAMRIFALPRLHSPEITAENFSIPKKFNLNEYLQGSLNVFKGGQDYEVVIDFDAWAADLVRGRTWHASQEMTELPRRQLRLRLRLNSIEEAQRWVLSWGEHAIVVEPRALAERLAQIGGVLQTRYGRPALKS
jgi:proteasome accessory factor B